MGVTGSRALRVIPFLFLIAAAGGCGVRSAAGQGAAGRAAPTPVSGPASAVATVSALPVATVTLSAVPTAHASPSTTVTPAGQVTLTAADNGITVVVSSGQTIVVDLAGRGVIQYRLPKSAGTALRLISSRGGYPTGRPAIAVFRPAAPGQAELTSETDAKCLHVAPRCMFAQQLWRVTVIVR
jgi:hypothetical protein